MRVWALGLWRWVLGRQWMPLFPFMPVAIRVTSLCWPWLNFWVYGPYANPKSVSLIFRVSDDHEGVMCLCRGSCGSWRCLSFSITRATLHFSCHCLVKGLTSSEPDTSVLFAPTCPKWEFLTKGLLGSRFSIYRCEDLWLGLKFCVSEKSSIKERLNFSLRGLSLWLFKK